MADGFHLHKEEAELSEVLQQLKTKISAGLNCHNLGRIIEFDKSTQTCTVELMQIKQFNGMLYPPPPITQVPLIIYGAGGGYITLPNPIGTICLLFFNDRDMDNFILTGEQYIPDTTRMHDFTDCIAITTFKTLANPLTDYDERAVSIFNEEVINEIKYSSYIKVYGNSIEINSADAENSSHISITPVFISENTAQKTETAENINITASEDINIDSKDYTNTNENLTVNSSSDIQINSEDYINTAENKILMQSSLGGSVSIGARVGISNNTQSLNLLIQSFLTACESITVKLDTGTLTDSSKAQFTNLKTQFQALLE